MNNQKQNIAVKKWSGVSMLEIRGLTYQNKDGTYLFRGVDLSVARGQVIGLKGYSGSGKTTLAKIVSGYVNPSEGRILLNGKPPHKPKEINPIQLAWQHPELAINPQWRLKKILAEVGTAEDEILQDLGIRTEWLQRYPNELSGGELQRFCLARALGKNTEFLIADEITTMLDAITQAQIWHTILRLVQEKKIGVLAISHDEKLLKAISTQIINLEDFK